MPRRSRCNRLTPAPSILPAQATVPGYIATALVAPRAGLKGAAATAQMAEDMRQAGHREGGITEGDLQLLGWTKGQIAEIGAAANIRAQQLAGATV
jgi:hypothetical protein